MAPDLVCPVRHGPADSYNELRYALRSAQANLDGLGEVWLLGSAPRWATGINHIRVAQNGSKYQNVRRLLRHAVESDLVSDPFIWVNDDIFWLSPQRICNMRLMHGGSLRQYLARMGRYDGWSAGGRRTVELLQREGYEDPLNWGLHVPLIVHKAPMQRALELTGDSSVAWHMRSLYGALAGLEGEKHTDVKIMGTATPSEAWPYVSTSDISFRTRPVGAAIRARFAIPSRYEKV